MAQIYGGGPYVEAHSVRGSQLLLLPLGGQKGPKDWPKEAQTAPHTPPKGQDFILQNEVLFRTSFWRMKS